MEGKFGSLTFQHGSRPDYPVNDKKANILTICQSQESQNVQGRENLTLNIVWERLSIYMSKRYIKYTVV